MQDKKSFTYDEIEKKMEHFCAYQERCHHEVEEKLRDFNLIPEAYEKIIIHLIQNKYLNEERYVELFVRSKCNQKKWGKIRIKNTLKQKKITETLIMKYLNQIDEEQYLSNLQYWISEKNSRLKEKQSFAKNQKIIHFLQYKGFEFDLILDNIKSES